nr:13713_t:CDS:2 [Entrophospora candida]
MLEMIGVLGPFYEFTQILGASDYVTISLVYPLINTLKEECKNTTNNVYDYEVDFESTDDVFDDVDVVYEEEDEENDNVGKIAEELLGCVLDPRTKKIKFSSQTIQEQTFTLLKTKFMEFSQIESQISTDNSIPKKIIKSNKIYKPTLLESTFDSQGKSALGE